MDSIVLGSDEGKLIQRLPAHGSVTIKVANGFSTIFETGRAAGEVGGPAMHSHPGFDETFYVISGEWEFEVGDDKFIGEPGMVVHIPRGNFHLYRSTGRLDGRLLVITVPGGIEDFFEESSAAKNQSEITAVGGKHGVVFEGR